MLKATPDASQRAYRAKSSHHLAVGISSVWNQWRLPDGCPGRAAIAFTAASLLLTQPAFTQDATDDQFGQVHFATSCNDVAQRRFDRAMRYQHLFWYQPAKENLRGDRQGIRTRYRLPGIALALGRNPHVAPGRQLALVG